MSKFLFPFLFISIQKACIQIWLFEQKDLRIEGRIIVSFFEFLLYSLPWQSLGYLRIMRYTNLIRKVFELRSQLLEFFPISCFVATNLFIFVVLFHMSFVIIWKLSKDHLRDERGKKWSWLSKLPLITKKTKKNKYMPLINEDKMTSFS